MAKPKPKSEYLERVKEFADNVLKDGRDCYHDVSLPLFAVGVDVRTKEQIKVRLNNKEHEEVVISNLADQQNLLRTLVGLSALVGDPVYENAAKATIRYHFEYFQDESGLMQWGSKRFIDLCTGNITGFDDSKGLVHEIKNCLPYYQLMYLVDPTATEKFVKSLWNAHVFQWKSLEINRYGYYGLPLGKLWAHEFSDTMPFNEAIGLSFLSTGNDLMYAAGMLYKYQKDERALLWMRRLLRQYVKARNPFTQLGAYQFNQAKKLESTNNDKALDSKYGDRAQRQFGPEFGPTALEGNVLFEGEVLSIYYYNALLLLNLVEELGRDKANEFVEWVRQGMVAYSRYAYYPEENEFHPMFTDGTDLSGYRLERDGYYGRSGAKLKPFPLDSRYLQSYAKTYVMTGDEYLWAVVNQMARGLDLGDIGMYPGAEPKVNLQTTEATAEALYAILYLYNHFHKEEYLELAKVIGDNILATKFNFGYFTQQKDCRYADFDAIEPLALLALCAAIKGMPELVPSYIGSCGKFESYVEISGKKVRHPLRELFEEKVVVKK